MRFQCRIEEGFVIAPQPPLRPQYESAPPPRLAPTPVQRPAANRRNTLARGAIASAVLTAAAGCAMFEPGGAKPWKVEPVFSITHSGQSSQAYYALGQYFDGSMAWDKAIDAYRKAVAADAGNIEAYGALGVALAQAGRLADAELTLRQAVALAPDLLRVRNNLGYVLLLAGKPEEAVLVLKPVVDRDGGNAIAAANLNQAMARSTGAVVASSEPRHAAVPTVAAAPVRVEPAAPPTSLRVGYAPTVAALEERVARVATAASPASPAVPAVPALPAAPSPAAQAVVASTQAVPPASRLEVSNGNGVAGMAARVGRWLAAHGMPTERLSNRQPFTQRYTVVQYRVGQEDAAQHIARLLPASAKAESRPTPGLRSDVRVVLGRDWVQAAACLERNTCEPESTPVAMAPRTDR
jgi:hypothetical protein